jgi:hypothetical protein
MEASTETTTGDSPFVVLIIFIFNSFEEKIIVLFDLFLSPYDSPQIILFPADFLQLWHA